MEIDDLMSEIDALQKDMRRLQAEWAIRTSLYLLTQVYVFILLSAWVKTQGWLRPQPNGQDLLLIAWMGAWLHQSL